MGRIKVRQESWDLSFRCRHLYKDDFSVAVSPQLEGYRNVSALTLKLV